MIYVHGKMMIVDDRLTIIGSGIVVLTFEAFNSMNQPTKKNLVHTQR